MNGAFTLCRVGLLFTKCYRACRRLENASDAILFESRCTQKFTVKRESEKRLVGQLTGSTSCDAHDGKARSMFCSGCTSMKLSSSLLRAKRIEAQRPARERFGLGVKIIDGTQHPVARPFARRR